jgi:hypothetical protein
VTVYVDGYTPAGRHVRVEGPSVYHATVTIDGTEIEQTGRPTLLRDGGTSTWQTASGPICKPAHIGPRADERPVMFDGEPLEPDRPTAVRRAVARAKGRR